jgi:predicted amidohydrolase
MKVASIQMDCILGDKEQNVKKALSLLDEACERGSTLVVLPELFSTGYGGKDLDMDLAEGIPGETTRKLGHIAQSRGICIAAALLERGESKGVIYDTAVLISPKGIEGAYRKIFLWDTERMRFNKGHSFPIFKSSFGNIGIQICYEVGFPEGARILTLKGADILLYPSAFGAKRYYIWDVATRSRALENGVFLIASNRSGKEDELEFAGHSRIVNPKGEILSEANQMDEVIVSEIDLDLVPLQRRAVPYLRDYERDTIIRALNEL